jgi:hypothetical protein
MASQFLHKALTRFATIAVLGTLLATGSPQSPSASLRHTIRAIRRGLARLAERALWLRLARHSHSIKPILASHVLS